MGTIVLLIVSIPLIAGIINYSLNFGSPEQTEEGTELVTQAVTPWWAGIVLWLSTKGTFGALVIIGLFMALKKMEIL